MNNKIFREKEMGSLVLRRLALLASVWLLSQMLLGCSSDSSNLSRDTSRDALRNESSDESSLERPQPPSITEVHAQNNGGPGGDERLIIHWNELEQVESYNLYWSILPSAENLNKIEEVSSPYHHVGIDWLKVNYYYLTAVVDGVESHLSNVFIYTRAYESFYADTHTFLYPFEDSLMAYLSIWDDVREDGFLAPDGEPVTYKEGVSGKAAHLSTALTTLTSESDHELEMRNGFAASIWLKAETKGLINSPLIFQGGENVLYSLSLSVVEGQQQLHLDMAGERLSALVNKDLTQWTLLSFNYDGSMAALFVNGKRVAEKAIAAETGISSSPIIIGGVSDELSIDHALNITANFVGAIDSFRIYNSSLNDVQFFMQFFLWDERLGREDSYIDTSFDPFVDTDELFFAMSGNEEAFLGIDYRSHVLNANGDRFDPNNWCDPNRSWGNPGLGSCNDESAVSMFSIIKYLPSNCRNEGFYDYDNYIFNPSGLEGELPAHEKDRPLCLSGRPQCRYVKIDESIGEVQCP